MVILVICISPSLDSYQETQSTLQFADRAKKAILNQAPMMMLSPSMSRGSENAMKLELEKLRKENYELKNQVRVLRQSNSQGSIQIVPLDSAINLISEMDEAKNLEQHQIETIDLRLATNGWEDGVGVVMERNEYPSTDYLLSDNKQEIEEHARNQIQLRSCFKGQRAIANPKV